MPRPARLQSRPPTRHSAFVLSNVGGGPLNTRMYGVCLTAYRKEAEVRVEAGALRMCSGMMWVGARVWYARDGGGGAPLVANVVASCLRLRVPSALSPLRPRRTTRASTPAAAAA